MLINEQYKKRVARIKVSVFFIIFMTTMMIGFNNAYAQSVFFIRAGATGANNGSDWTNAYISLPTKLQRGATYYVADGSYGGYNFNTRIAVGAVISP